MTQARLLLVSLALLLGACSTLTPAVPDPAVPNLATNAVTGGFAFKQLSAGFLHTCGLKVDGSAVCWGANYNSQLKVPEDTTFTQLSTGRYHTCGVKQSGSTVCWGANYNGQLSVPADTIFSQVSAGIYFTCGLKTADSAVCWGWNNYGQLNVPAATTFTQLSAGNYHACGLKKDGSAVCWGDNTYGQLNVLANTTFTQLSAGSIHTCGLKQDGSAVCWGANYSGQRNVPANTTFTYLSAGSNHTCGFKTDRSAVCWGWNQYGQLNVPADTTFTYLSAGGNHTCGLKQDGSAMCWGDNGYGQAAPPTPPTISQEPQTTSAEVDQPFTLSVTASGDGLSYSWRKDGVALDGATGSSYTVASAALTDAGSYDVVVSNEAGRTTSNAVNVTVTPGVPTYTLDFDAAPVGIIWNVTVGRGISGPTTPDVVTVMGLRRGGRGNTARVVDEQDKVLVVAPNRRSLEPNARGGLIDLNFVRFGRRVTVASLELSGITTSGGRVELWGGGRKLSSTVVPLGENTLALETPGVTRLRIFLTGPGAVDDVVVAR